MKRQRLNSKEEQSQLGLFENPYAFIDPDESDVGEPLRTVTTDQKREYLRKLQNPYAYHAIFDEEEIPPVIPPQRQALHPSPVSGDKSISKDELEGLLDEVLGLYKPFVARDDWSQVDGYRNEFLVEATRTPTTMTRVAKRLQELKFALAPGERVEQNRAPASRIIGELKKLLR